MEALANLLSNTLSLFQIPINIWGFSFSFWQVFLFTCIASIVCWFLGRFFGGE